MTEIKLSRKNRLLNNGTTTEKKENPFVLVLETRANGEITVYDRMQKKDVATIKPDKKGKMKTTPLMLVDETFFLEGKDKDGVWRNSTEYRNVADEIAVFERGVNKPVHKGAKKDLGDLSLRWKFQTLMNLYCVSTLGIPVVVKLSASARSAYMDFKKKVAKESADGDFYQTGAFQITGTRLFINEKHKNENEVFVPVFELYETTEQDEEKTDGILSTLVEYLGTPGYEAIKSSQAIFEPEKPAEDLPF